MKRSLRIIRPALVSIGTRRATIAVRPPVPPSSSGRAGTARRRTQARPPPTSATFLSHSVEAPLVPAQIPWPEKACNRSRESIQSAGAAVPRCGTPPPITEERNAPRIPGANKASTLRADRPTVANRCAAQCPSAYQRKRRRQSLVRTTRYLRAFFASLQPSDRARKGWFRPRTRLRQIRRLEHRWIDSRRAPLLVPPPAARPSCAFEILQYR